MQSQTRVEDARRRVSIAVSLLEEKGVMNRDPKAYIDAQDGELSIQVLIVDDKPAIRTIVKEAMPNFEVVRAGDGEEALERIKEHQPDLVVEDITDGWLYPAHPPPRAIPGNAGVGLSGPVDIDEIENHSFDGFIEKPIELEEFKQLVKEDE